MHVSEWKILIGKKQSNVQQTEQIWMTLPPEYIKIDTAAAFGANSWTRGWGCVGRGEDGTASLQPLHL